MLRSDSDDQNNGVKNIEDLFAIKGTAGAYGLKDRFNVPEANLGSRARSASGGRVREISPMRVKSITGNGYQELPSFQNKKRPGVTSSTKKANK